MLKNRKCSYCDEELIENRCKECDSPYRISEGWTSGDVCIDTFIKDTMYKARNGGRWLEWISFDRIIDIELYEDGFDKVYVAVWLDGRDNYLEQNGSLKNEPQPVKVFLKQFNLLTNCLNEIKNHWEFFNIDVAISSKFYGMSKHPETQEFIMVTHYGNQKSLRTLLENDKKLLWKQKIEILRDTSFKLKKLHELGYSHNNFHYGSIMLDDDSKIYITNFKLTQSIKQRIAPNNKVLELMPYIAPEIIKGESYSLASDIYNFGIVMIEFSTGKCLFENKVRPEFGKGTPEIYKDFVNKCINVNPDRRPTAPGLYKQLKFWYKCIIGDCAEFDKYGEMVKSAFDNADNYNDEDVEGNYI
ncbi:15934_t:CDS:2 [Funneliformis mosseae]|uniref:15934_t:CDS:1 n=1 Tax=Funneliformis mosseae TaxID=27381 RepID=A0A9N8W4J2_FUNMO|nr:15934_t:CDS:2 [Funneliformis mosseae]